MRISYNWLTEYLPNGLKGAGTATSGNEVNLTPERLSYILTSVGLEVESMEKFQQFTGGLEGLVAGEVLECIKHPQADKLSVTKVEVAHKEILQIVCGAPNVAVGQKVIVAPAGSTIYPIKGEPVTMKKAKIRGMESQGMICAQDEIGIGTSHDGIVILPPETPTGALLTDVLKPYSDWVIEIGLTANRMDAMSHIGVARDVCAWLSHQNKRPAALRLPSVNAFKAANNTLPVSVTIENQQACQRYAGVSISGVTVTDSPEWLQQRLKSIGIRPVNNIVDITNFVLHESGQPLHAFDLDKIEGRAIRIKNLPEGTSFITLDEKERKLDANDLMICNGYDKPLCIAGVFGGLDSGVSETTTNIFIESAWFEPSSTRKTSLRHGLRTDAAVRFEKGVDISNTLYALKRAALLIVEMGGTISSEIIDIYPDPKPKKEVILKNHYLKKISGKNYHADTVKNILQNLGFEIIKEGLDDIRVAAPYNKPDIRIPADIIEEIMRIDGYDNVEIPGAITISPSSESHAFEDNQKERTANYLVGLGFSEIFTNSITNSAYYSEPVLKTAVRLMNSLSEGLDIMRPSLLESGLQVLEYNINRKNADLALFEFGKVYSTTSSGYLEQQRLSIFSTGNKLQSGWQQQEKKTDLYFIKGVCEKLLELTGIKGVRFTEPANGTVSVMAKGQILALLSQVNDTDLKKFSIKQPVYYAEIYWDELLVLAKARETMFEEIARYPIVHRDLSLVVNKDLVFDQLEQSTLSAGIPRLTGMKLFDVFESDKLGEGKKSYAINLTFSDHEKTLTDKEIEEMMNKLISTYEKDLGAEIRKA